MAEQQRDWHRLFGMSWADWLAGLPVVVEMEKDLSLKQQLLDVVILRKSEGALPVPLPDGFEELAAHNLISFKSHQEALDGWALDELVGHYVNYRKQAGPSVDEMPDLSQFRLFAVTVRSPASLARQVQLQPLRAGVYEARHFSGAVRIIVVHELPRQEQNAMLLLFSAKAELVQYGSEHYRPRAGDTSTFLHKLFDRYRSEGVPVPFTREQFYREARREIWDGLTAQERLESFRRTPAEEQVGFLRSLSAGQRLELINALPAEERTRLVSALPPEERVKGLAPEQRLEGLSVEQRLAGLSPAELEELRRLLAGGGLSPASGD